MTKFIEYLCAAGMFAAFFVSFWVYYILTGQVVR